MKDTKELNVITNRDKISREGIEEQAYKLRPLAELIIKTTKRLMEDEEERAAFEKWRNDPETLRVHGEFFERMRKLAAESEREV